MLGTAVLCLSSSLPAVAQAPPAWNDARSRQVVELASARRAQQLADTGLADYQATARGYLTFLAQLGEGFTEPPRIVKADQLALEVYWKAPALSKQRILGRRDTLLLPTDINYHRDHLGIIQNNFPDIIRLGDGDEVRDVPHPLSPRGLEAYDFLIADSLRIVIPGRGIDVYQVKVRPKDDRQARVIGALFIDRESGQVVRMAFNFTRAAFLDKNLEDLAIVLENRLVGTRFWLPSRQEIEIRRTGRWLDYPARGIIRGRWEIGEYRINQGLAATMFAGPEIVQAPAAERQRYPWSGRVLDSLPPDVRATSDEDVRRVHEEARALVRAQALETGRSATVAGRALSDFLRYNRAEGVSIGAGFRQRFGNGFGMALRARYGFADSEPKGELSVGWQNAAGRGLRARVMADFVDVGDDQERSTVVNSLAAQEFASDYTEPVFTGFAGLTVDLGRIASANWSVDAGLEATEWRRVAASPARGAFRPTLPVPDLSGGLVRVRAELPTRLAWFGTELSGRMELRLMEPYRPCGTVPQTVLLGIGAEDGAPCAMGTIRRASLTINVERPFAAHRLVARLTASEVNGAHIPLNSLVYFGGPVSGPGYEYHQFVGVAGMSQRAEWRMPIPFPAVRLGRFGRAPATATIAPFGHIVAIREVSPIDRVPTDTTSAYGVIRGGSIGWRGYPSVGVGLLTLFDIVRLDVARGLRNGRWTFSVDVSREFWRVL